MPKKVNDRERPKKTIRKKPVNTIVEEKELKSIWIIDKTFYFYENSYRTWLKKFNTILSTSNTYELIYDENNKDSCLLGQGGNGFVLKYKCNDENFAIKFLTNEQNKNKEVRKLKELNSIFKGDKSSNYRVTRFIDEGQVTLNLFGQNYRLFFIVMDLADGTIKNLMCDHFNEHNADLETSDLLKQIKHLSETINVMHNANYAHRDIKPENILLKGNYPILADFGLSGSCEEEIRKKGPKYWPNPEFIQACDKELQTIDLKSDIFNLGCLFFYFFTKKYPIGLIDIDYELSSINEDIRNILCQMIHYDKESRLENISDILTVIEKKITNVA